MPPLVENPRAGPVSCIHLLCVAGPELGESFTISEPVILIGRGQGDISLRGADVSRKHARITRLERRFWLEDLSSVNGTFLNGGLIQGAHELAIGDRVQVGSTILVFTRTDELEERLRQEQKLDAMGALVKGIAHDFNNTLQVMLCGIAQLEALAPSDEMHAVLEEMAKASTSARGLVRRLMGMGRNKPETQDLVDVDDVVRSIVAMAKRVSPQNIKISVDGTASVLVRGSRSELEQALLNALLNSRDAMPGGGRISISFVVVNLDPAAGHARHVGGNDTFVEVRIRDEGMGMDAQTAARAFEPLFTTKGGNGSGLGLAMLYSTVKSHGGTVVLESTPGAGTLITLTLPVAS